MLPSQLGWQPLPGRLPSRPGWFAVGAVQAASGWNATVMSAHTAEHTISIVTVEAAAQSAAAPVALAGASETLRRPAASPSR